MIFDGPISASSPTLGNEIGRNHWHLHKSKAVLQLAFHHMHRSLTIRARQMLLHSHMPLAHIRGLSSLAEACTDDV